MAKANASTGTTKSLQELVDAQIITQVNALTNEDFKKIFIGPHNNWSIKPIDNDIYIKNVNIADLKTLIGTLKYDHATATTKINSISKPDFVAAHIATYIIKRRATYLYLYLRIHTNNTSVEIDLNFLKDKVIEIKTKLNNDVKNTANAGTDIKDLLDEVLNLVKTMKTAQDTTSKFWSEAVPLLTTEQPGLPDGIKA
jgi:hypothetical protein